MAGAGPGIGQSVARYVKVLVCYYRQSVCCYFSVPSSVSTSQKFSNLKLRKKHLLRNSREGLTVVVARRNQEEILKTSSDINNLGRFLWS